SVPIAGHISTASLVSELSTGGDTHPNSPAKKEGEAARCSSLVRLFSAASPKVRVKVTSDPTRASQGGRLRSQSFAAPVSWSRLAKPCCLRPITHPSPLQQ